MSKLEDAMLKYMKKIVSEESRPFSYGDFFNFEIDGTQYSAIYGTIRNIFSKFTKAKKIEFCYRDVVSFYTLPGYQFGKKMMTDNQADITSILNHPIYKIIKNIPFKNRCIHDIHITFKAEGLWQLLSQREEFKQRIHSKNKSIVFGYFEIEKNITVNIIIQKTDTVNVVVGCSQQPIPLDSHGIIRLTEALTRGEERLAAVLNDSKNYTHNVEFNPNTIRIPNKDKWTVTLWHIGRDSFHEYSGERFHCSWQVAKNLFLRIYSKEMKLQTIKDKGTIIRTEVQENPKMSIDHLTEFVKNSNENLPSKFFENNRLF